MSRYAPVPELHPLVRLMVRAGWVMTRVSGGHAVWAHPRGGTISIPWHPGAYRRRPRAVETTRANIRRALRRAGEVEPPC
jgi:predicted RNA binding protein YcfA (HicA-like mRNA interferase family)